MTEDDGGDGALYAAIWELIGETSSNEPTLEYEPFSDDDDPFGPVGHQQEAAVISRSVILFKTDPQSGLRVREIERSGQVPRSSIPFRCC